MNIIMRDVRGSVTNLFVRISSAVKQTPAQMDFQKKIAKSREINRLKQEKSKNEAFRSKQSSA